jgi:hypothetical protein
MLAYSLQNKNMTGFLPRRQRQLREELDGPPKLLLFEVLEAEPAGGGAFANNWDH